LHMHSLHLKREELPIGLEELKKKALHWAAAYEQVAFYEPNQIPYPHGGFLNLLAVSNQAPSALLPGQHFSGLKKVLEQKGQLLCGLLAYDLKNEVEALDSRLPDQIGFPQMHFFRPQIYLLFSQDAVQIVSQEVEGTGILNAILEVGTSRQNSDLPAPQVKQRVTKEEYVATVQKIRQDIEEGQVYELTYCLEFFAENIPLDPVHTFWDLNKASPMPFAGFYKLQNRYLLCASPERFLKKEQEVLISQPIKGTIRRGSTPAEDAFLQNHLLQDEKERAENMMIVDLVRNDLRRSCATGTVRVEELFRIYGFEHVSQMISTVTGRLRPACGLVDALRGAFPMGSMTGAPKIRAMELIEQYEKTRRGLFSGSIGYVLPNGDADFNVVIRSMQYNAATGYLSFLVGSAITYDSDPDQEYEECLLKARAILQVLGQPVI
jgi:para-aminobenzoate synthetase component I